MAGADRRGANQSLVGFSSAGRGGGAGSAGVSAPPVGVPPPGAGVSGSGSPVPPSPSPTGLRTTTGGMGRDPGMLIRIRVVSVVSVLRSSGRVAERPPSVPVSEPVGVP
ncbi:putative protein OS=Streptomyces fumanus OX=67302 GN=GCM10018772_49200 PE=4 SV=1 [Streptomyces fumanus]|uniref:Uncharacterized protein n=1 Tax=Streptomyces fumanus TaxID=67302 RepID=A0A919APQ2_9ACTN|nr:hypothetical protein GCM10018772_49200 [Streptomyces fumanus]